MPSSMSQARIVPFAAPLFAMVLHGLLRIGVCEAHPASTGLCAGLSLVVVTLCERVPRLGRVCVRLLVFAIFAPARVVHGLSASTLVVLVWAMLLAWSVVGLTGKLVQGAGGAGGRPLERLLTAVTLLSPQAAAFARAEWALFRFGLLRWRPEPVPAGAAPYPNVTDGLEIPMLWLSAAGMVVEIPLLHVLLGHFSSRVAWLVTAIEALSMLYLAGYAKSVRFCPTLLYGDHLLIRLGAIASRAVPRSAIEAAWLLPPDKTDAPGVRMYGLDAPNIAVRACGETLSFRVDHPERLLIALQPGSKGSALGGVQG